MLSCSYLELYFYEIRSAVSIESFPNGAVQSRKLLFCSSCIEKCFGFRKYANLRLT